MAVNRGLGKGLSALFSDTDAEYQYSSSKNEERNKTVEGKSGILMLEVDQLYANPAQPRKTFSPESISELALSIKQHGILQPILVCCKNNRFMIIAGERRFKAALEAGLTQVPVIVREYSDRKIMEISLIENLQREDLNPVEAALAMKQLLEKYSLTQEMLSQQIGKSRPAIANMLRLLTLPEEVINMLKQNLITEGHARCLVGLQAHRAAALAKEVYNKRLSVRELEKLVKNVDNNTGGGKLQINHSPELKSLVSDMQHIFGTKVTAMGTDTKGKIYIDYFSSDDIERIYEMLEKFKKIFM